MMVQEHEMESIMPSMQSLNIAGESETTAIPPIRYNNSNRLIPVPFHSTKAIGEKIIVQILKTEAMYVGTLALGLTSCNPASLNPNDLPDDSDCLLDRPEYWVVTKDIASTPQRGDEIAFSVTPTGEVTISKNCGPAVIVMHVDISLQLWAFLDVYGSTESIR
uniref:NHR domain-containing protein n=1 Tax=Megaselia scalaris TaxID=36166 RepID=T1H2U1_MEGSC